MAFAGMVIAALFIIVIILSVLFIIGLIFLIIGLVLKRKEKKKESEKKYPVVLIVIGCIFIVPSILATGLVIWAVLDTKIDRAMWDSKYDTVPDLWRNESVLELEAQNQIVKALFTAAESGDHNEFAENFTNDIREQRNFDEMVNEFLENYPDGLADIVLAEDDLRAGGERRLDYGTGDLSYECDLDGETYFIELRYCYLNDDDPDEVGVTSFTIRNLESRAYFLFGNSREMYEGEDETLLCDIKSSAEVSAMKIGGSAYLWTPSDGPVLSADEMSQYLSQYNTLREAIEAGGIGHPNVEIEYSNSAGIIYFYELAPENGEARFARISANSSYGRITNAYLCSPDESFYDQSIV